MEKKRRSREKETRAKNTHEEKNLHERETVVVVGKLLTEKQWIMSNRGNQKS